MTDEDAPSSVWQLQRNDAKACVAYYDEHGVTSDEYRVMLMLQDNASELLALSVDWKVRKPPSPRRRF